MAPEPNERQFSLRDAARWFALGVGSIAVAGGFALFLVLARIPGIAEIVVTDPQFAWRGLIVHVNLALGVWFFAFLAGLFCLLPGARNRRITPIAFALAILGTLAFTATAFVDSAEPMRSNYVPALDHWLFLAGLGMFAGAVALNYFDIRFLAREGATELPGDARVGVKAAAIAYLTAMATIVAAYATQPEGVLRIQYYERLFWGGGHVLQFANVLGMVSAWLLLLSRVLKRPVFHRGAAALLFVLLLLPSLAGPWITLTDAPPQYFTQMMRWGIFPVVSLFIIACAWSLRTAATSGELPRGALRSPAFVGFCTGAVMTVLGFLLGASIRDSSTLVPAHYHMSIGAVTATYMAALLVLLDPLGAPLPTARTRKWAMWQPLVFGVGQAIFAAGFGIAGFFGAERKAYGSDQVVKSPEEVAGLITMGVGGLIASVGGITFLTLLIVAWRARPKVAARADT
jgi:hypothetical protein